MKHVDKILYISYIYRKHTSTGTNTALSLKAEATSEPFEAGKSQITTLAPFRTSLSAVARPKPDAAPVTSATNPYSKISIINLTIIEYANCRQLNHIIFETKRYTHFHWPDHCEFQQTTALHEQKIRFTLSTLEVGMKRRFSASAFDERIVFLEWKVCHHYVTYLADDFFELLIAGKRFIYYLYFA